MQRLSEVALERKRARDRVRAQERRLEKAEYDRARRQLKREQIQAYDRARYAADPDKKKAWARRYVAANRPKVAARFRERYRTDPVHRLKVTLRNSVNRGLKTGSAVRDLGCTVAELKKHLEARFAPGMSWENHGAWHIDHIRPLAKFDLMDRVQFLQAVHYTNLQPLWSEDNLRKGSR